MNCDLFMSRTVLKLYSVNGNFDFSIYPLRRSVLFQSNTFYQGKYRLIPAMATPAEIEEGCMSNASPTSEVEAEESNIVKFDRDTVEAARKKGRNQSRRR